MSSDDILRIEQFKIERFMGLGLGRYQAIRAVEDAVDWHAVATLVKKGCMPALAVEISR